MLENPFVFAHRIRKIFGPRMQNATFLKIGFAIILRYKFKLTVSPRRNAHFYNPGRKKQQKQCLFTTPTFRTPPMQSAYFCIGFPCKR